MSARLTWKALDEAGEASTAANRPAYLPQMPAFSGQTFFWPRNLPQERYNSWESVPKKEIPVIDSVMINKIDYLRTCKKSNKL